MQMLYHNKDESALGKSEKEFVTGMGSPNLRVYDIFIDKVCRQYTGFSVGFYWLLQEKWWYLSAVPEIGGNIRLITYVLV